MANFIPIQAQAFLLYGNGAVIGNTTLILTSFKDIDGNLITMQGTEMTGTIEPNSGSSEEQIIFTGVTQNANGTATLTGVSSVTFASPYTLTSGVIKSHAGNSTFVLSDTAYLYSKYAILENTQTFTGSDTFTIAPFIPTVLSGAINQAASVGYVNATAIAGSPKATNIVFGIVELSVAAATASVPIAVGDNDSRVPTIAQTAALVGNDTTIAVGSGNKFVTQTGLQNSSEKFATTTGSANAYILTLSPVPTAYKAGQVFEFVTNFTNSGAATLNVNSLGAKNIVKTVTTTVTTALASGDISSGQAVTVMYDGTQFQLQSPIANVIVTPYITGFGAWGSATFDGAGHQVTTDGFLVGWASGSTFTGFTVLSDSASTPTNQRAQTQNSSGGVSSFMIPVKKNDYYKVTVSGGPATNGYFFIPIS